MTRDGRYRTSTRCFGMPRPTLPPRAGADDWSLMLYTSGTTASQRACRAGTAPSAPRHSPMWRRISTRTASARSASCRSITPWACARCWPWRWSTALRVPARALSRAALALIDARAGDQPLSRADALPRSRASPGFAGDRRQLGAQARLCRRADDRRAAEATAGGVQARTVRQSLRLVGDLYLHHRAERAGEAGLRGTRRHQPAHPRREARRAIADESPRSARKARSSRFCPATRRSRAIGAGRTPTRGRCATAGISPATPAISTRDGDLFVTGRVDDMIITGGENVSPVEIEALPVAASGGVARSPSSACRTSAGARSSPPSSSAAHAVDPDGARRVLPRVGARRFQAAAALCLCRRNPEIAGRQASAPQARCRRV